MNSIIEQVRQARATFDEAHRAAETAAAAVVDRKRFVGSNETERKAARSVTPPDEYDVMLGQLAEAERTKAAAVAHLERVEKNLNTLREELNHEAAEINLRAADRLYAAQERAAETAEKYRQMPGNHTLGTELRARWPLVPVLAGDDDPNDPPF